MSSPLFGRPCVTWRCRAVKALRFPFLPLVVLAALLDALSLALRKVLAHLDALLPRPKDFRK